ncbi:uncharacterized protein [Diadema antillarum]|uniref:uncharacterized protein n=1 Tax=Diadema antillarum TaxID=105358 RepID=UPI003A83F4DD
MAETLTMEDRSSLPVTWRAQWTKRTKAHFKESTGKAKKEKRPFGVWKTVIPLILVATCCSSSASANDPRQLTLGEVGSITFDAPWNPEDGLFPHFTIQFESQSQPFCTLIQRHQRGFKSPSQHDRFRVSYTLGETDLQATTDISDVSHEDAGVYIMILTSIDAASGTTIRVVKEIKVSPPLGEAQCRILDAPEGYSNHYANVACRAVAGSGNVTLACYQDGVRIPYMREIRTNGEYVYGSFWMKSGGSPVLEMGDLGPIELATQCSCCSSSQVDLMFPSFRWSPPWL